MADKNNKRISEVVGCFVSPGLRAQIVKELLSILRDKKTRIIIVVPPVLQLFIFAFAITLEVNNTTIAVYNRDSGEYSQKLMAKLGRSSFVKEIHTLSSEQEISNEIDMRRALLVVSFPLDFSRRIGAGEQAQLQVIGDGRRANSAQVAMGYLSDMLLDFSAEMGRGLPVENVLVVRNWFNENLHYRWFVVPALSGIISLLLSFILTALSIARERELGTFDQLLVSPCTSWEIVAAKITPSMIIGMLLGNIILCAGIFFFKIPFQGSLWLLELSLLVFTLAIASIGLMVSAVSNTQQQAVLGSFAVIVPLILCSGFATPISNMPTILQYLSTIIPLTHYIIIVEGTFLKAMPLWVIWEHIGIMTLIAVAFLVGSVVLVRRKLQ